VVTEYHGKFVGGRLCLDFVNTVGGRTARGAVIRDKLATLDDLLAWGRAAGMRTPVGGARRPASLLSRAIRFREALYRILVRARPAAADVAILRREVAEARAHQRLASRGRQFSWVLADSRSPECILWTVALSAAELLTSEDRARLRQCGGHECGWLFLDTSRNGRRRWCDMQDCGNRAKVRRFREKRAGQR